VGCGDPQLERVFLVFKSHRETCGIARVGKRWSAGGGGKWARRLGLTSTVREHPPSGLVRPQVLLAVSQHPRGDTLTAAWCLLE
jgi:hypothetical protein